MAAPKGNQFAEGHGRPPIYEDTPESVEKVSLLVDDYFEWIKGESETKTRKVIVSNKETGDNEVIEQEYEEWIRRPEPPTVTGLTLHLGFSSKDTLYAYAKKNSFSYSIKKGLCRIEQSHEFKIAYGDKCTGNIFALKNMGWADRVEQDISLKTDTSKYSDDELKDRINELSQES